MGHRAERDFRDAVMPREARTWGQGLRVATLTVAIAMTATACGIADGFLANDQSSSASPRVTETAAPPTHSPGTSSDDGSGSPSDSVVGDGLVDAHVIEHEGRNALIVTLPLEQWDVRVDWEPGGTMLGDLIEDDPSIAAATNAGIFTMEVTPGGLLVTDSETVVPVNLNEGGGNFHLMPNGVFAVLEDGTATVVNSTQYDPAGVVHATQSGPALLLDGEIHPEFREGSTNMALRSGVGVSPDGETVYLAMSGWTNLWDFATLFRDQLGVDDALYLDGQISDIWVQGMREPGPVAGPYAGIITARAKN